MFPMFTQQIGRVQHPLQSLCVADYTGVSQYEVGRCDAHTLAHVRRPAVVRLVDRAEVHAVRDPEHLLVRTTRGDVGDVMPVSVR